MNLMEMCNIIKTLFNKTKFKYLIQVWEDVMKIVRNVKNVNVKKILWWRHHLKIPTPLMSPLVTNLGYPLPPSPSDVLFERPLSNNHGCMQNCVFSVLDRKYPFWASFVPKFKIVSITWNLVPRLIRICRSQ